MRTKRTFNQRELAKVLNKDFRHINAVLNGKSQASIKLALEIERETRGEVKATELRPDLKDMAPDLFPSAA